MKPGYKSTEFWLTVSSLLVTVGSITGVIGTPDVEGVLHAAQSIVLAVFSAISAAIYIWGRIMVKVK